MDTKEKVIQTAAGLFLQMGIKTVTMDFLCRHMNISKRTLYELFESKNELVKHVLFYLAKQENNTMMKIINSNDDIINAIIEIGRHKLELFKNLPPHIFQEIKDYSFQLDIYNYISENMKKEESASKHLLNKGIEQGALRKDIRIDLVERFIQEIMVLVYNEDWISSSKCSPEELRNSIILPYYRGLCTEQGLQKLNKKCKTEFENL